MEIAWMPRTVMAAGLRVSLWMNAPTTPVAPSKSTFVAGIGAGMCGCHAPLTACSSTGPRCADLIHQTSPCIHAATSSQSVPSASRSVHTHTHTHTYRCVNFAHSNPRTLSSTAIEHAGSGRQCTRCVSLGCAGSCRALIVGSQGAWRHRPTHTG